MLPRSPVARPARPALALLAALAFSACGGTPEDGRTVVTVSVDPASILADGLATAHVTVTATDGGGMPVDGTLLLRTTKGHFEGDRQSVTGTLTGGTFQAVLTSCNSGFDPACAGTATLEAQLGPVTGRTSLELRLHAVERACEDGLDDDGDGPVDCADPDCEGVALSHGAVCSGGAYACPGGEAAEASCGDGLDNDCDGIVDCADPDCFNLACAEHAYVCTAEGECVCGNAGAEGTTLTDCRDGVDNDCDGRVDGEDPHCEGRPCDGAGNRWTSAGAPELACGCFQDQDRETACGDGFDNDCDGLADCADPDCQDAACQDASLAPNHVGLTCDALAAACVCELDETGSGLEAACDDGRDDDCDGLVDCADVQNCQGRSCGLNGLLCNGGACECPGGTRETACNDGLDNDCDGSVDCTDADCAGLICGAHGMACAGDACACPGGEDVELTCGDQKDNDCNGLVDCLDPACDGLACGSGKICDLAQSTCVNDPGFDRLIFTADRTRVLADGVAEVVLAANVTDNNGPRAGVDVTFRVPVGQLVESASGEHVAQTDASGNALVRWRPGTEPGRDVAPTASIATPTAVTTKSVAVQVIGLSNVEVKSVQYTKMGVRSSGYQETSIIQFRVTGTDGIDSNLVIPDGVRVRFDAGTGTGIQLKPAEAVTLAGVASTTAESGFSATTFSVRAVADVGPISDEVTTGAIAVVGAKPSHRGFTFDCAVKNVGALVEKTGVNSTVHQDVACTVALQDRFSNPIGISIPVSFQAEAGAVDSPIQTRTSGAVGTAVTQFHTFGPLPKDVDPMPGEPSYAGTVGTAPRTFNPRDGLVSIIAFTTGEEEFNDENSSGFYDDGEAFVDLAEPFIDKNDNSTRDPGEEYVDVDFNGRWDGPNGRWDGNTIIWTETRLLETGNPTGLEGSGFVPAYGLLVPNGGSTAAVLRLADENLNVPRSKTATSLRVVTGNVKASWITGGTAAATVPDTLGMGWQMFKDCNGTPCDCVENVCSIRTEIGPFAPDDWGLAYGVVIEDSQPTKEETKAFTVQAEYNGCTPVCAFQAVGTGD